jgi:hypothetical protein
MAFPHNANHFTEVLRTNPPRFPHHQAAKPTFIDQINGFAAKGGG